MINKNNENNVYQKKIRISFSNLYKITLYTTLVLITLTFISIFNKDIALGISNTNASNTDKQKIIDTTKQENRTKITDATKQKNTKQKDIENYTILNTIKKENIENKDKILAKYAEKNLIPKNTQLNIVLIGPPGVGKSHISQVLQARYNIPIVSVGDLIRKEMTSNSLRGRIISKHFNKHGIESLLSNKITNEIILEYIKKLDCTNGMILDGYPRTIEQVKMLERILKNNAKKFNIENVKNIIIVLDANDEDLMALIEQRAICAKCALEQTTEKEKKLCNKICDGFENYTRQDDTEDIAKKRIQIYKDETKPIVAYYKNYANVKAKANNNNNVDSADINNINTNNIKPSNATSEPIYFIEITNNKGNLSHIYETSIHFIDNLLNKKIINKEINK